MRLDYLVITTASASTAILTTNQQQFWYLLGISVVSFAFYLKHFYPKVNHPIPQGQKVLINIKPKPNNPKILLLPQTHKLHNTVQEVQTFLPNTQLYKLKGINQLFDKNWIYPISR